MASYRFVLLDVFTDRPLTGNPLPLVPRAAGLTDAQMQALAREFNASESTFVVPPTDPRATRRLKCFSPTHEVFGAGHNALGAWWGLAADGDIEGADGEVRYWQELGPRVLPVDVTRAGGRLVRVAMTQATPVVTPGVPDRGELARALRLDAEAFAVDGLEPQVMSTGATHMLVPVRNRSDLERANVDADRLIAIATPFGCKGCYLFCLEPLDAGSTACARGFFPAIGISEDPATGSAAGPLAAYLVARRRAREGTWLTIEQGDAMGRASRIEARVLGDRVDVAGRCAVVGEGTLTI